MLLHYTSQQVTLCLGNNRVTRKLYTVVKNTCVLKFIIKIHGGAIKHVLFVFHPLFYSISVVLNLISETWKIPPKMTDILKVSASRVIDNEIYDSLII